MAAACAAGAAAPALLALAGGWLGVPWLSRLASGGPAMLPATAFAVLAASAAIVARSARVLGVAVAAGGAFALSAHATTSMWAGALPSPHTATPLLALGAGIVLRDSRLGPAWPALSALSIAGLALIGHLYRLTPLYALSERVGMSLPSALAIALLAAGLIASRPQLGVARFLSQDSAGSWLARRLLPLAVLLPWVAELGSGLGVRAGLYPESGVGPARLLLVMLTIAGVAYTLAVSANRIDAQRKAAEQAVQRHEREREALARTRVLTTALEAAHNGVAIVGRDGHFQWVNPAFERLTGYARDEVVGQSPRLLKSGQHPRELYEALWKTVLSGKVWQGQLVNRRKDGTLYDEEQTVTPVLDPAGEITHFIAIKLDVSARLAAEAERERLVVELKDALDNVRTLSGFIPICASCKKIRNDTGYWDAIESYISRHTDAQFTHGICPECVVRLYPDE